MSPWRYLDTYFRKCSNLLAEDGSMLLQAIVMADRNYPRYLRSVDFTDRTKWGGANLKTMPRASPRRVDFVTKDVLS